MLSTGNEGGVFFEGLDGGFCFGLSFLNEIEVAEYIFKYMKI